MVDADKQIIAYVINAVLTNTPPHEPYPCIEPDCEIGADKGRPCPKACSVCGWHDVPCYCACT